MTWKTNKNTFYSPFGTEKEDMGSFYRPKNKALSHLVEKLNPPFEQLPVRKDYNISKFKLY
jgi:hypothetical protein